jgi:hypothetical protein
MSCHEEVYVDQYRLPGCQAHITHVVDIGHRTCSGWRLRPLRLRTVAGTMVILQQPQSQPWLICAAACELLQTPNSCLVLDQYVQ